MCDLVHLRKRGGEDGAGDSLCSARPLAERQRPRRSGDDDGRSPAVKKPEGNTNGGNKDRETRSEGGPSCEKKAEEAERTERGARPHQLRRDASPFQPSFASSSPSAASFLGFVSSLSPAPPSHGWQMPNRRPRWPASPASPRNFSVLHYASGDRSGPSLGPHFPSPLEASSLGLSLDVSCQGAVSSPSPSLSSSASSLSSVHRDSSAPLKRSVAELTPAPSLQNDETHGSPFASSSPFRSSSFPPPFASALPQSFPPYFSLPTEASGLPFPASCAAKGVPAPAEFDGGVCTPDDAVFFFSPSSDATEQDLALAAWPDSGEAFGGFPDEAQDLFSPDNLPLHERPGDALPPPYSSPGFCLASWHPEQEGAETVFGETADDTQPLGPEEGEAYLSAVASYSTPCAPPYALPLYCAGDPAAASPEAGKPDPSQFAQAENEKSGVHTENDGDARTFSSFGNPPLAVASALFHDLCARPTSHAVPASCPFPAPHGCPDASPLPAPGSSSSFPVSSFPSSLSSCVRFASPVAEVVGRPVQIPARLKHSLAPRDGSTPSEIEASVPFSGGHGQEQAAHAGNGLDGISSGFVLSASAPSWEMPGSEEAQWTEEPESRGEASAEQGGEERGKTPTEKPATQLRSRASPFYPSSSFVLQSDAPLSSLSSFSSAFPSSVSASSFPSSHPGEAQAEALSSSSAFASSSAFSSPPDCSFATPFHAQWDGEALGRQARGFRREEREEKRGPWLGRDMRFYEEIADLLSSASLSSASEDETGDEWLTSAEDSQEGTEPEEAEEEQTEGRSWVTENREHAAQLPRLMNPTPFAGIEKSGKNERDLVHAVAQAVFFTPIFKEPLANHLCDRNACVACELGFLLHMLDLARTEADPCRRICQSRNFQRILSELPRMRRERVFHAFLPRTPSEGEQNTRGGPFSALARRTRVFFDLLLEHLREDLTTASSPSAPSSLVEFLFRLREPDAASGEQRDAIEIDSRFILPLRYPRKEVSVESDCSSDCSVSSSSLSPSPPSSFSSKDREGDTRMQSATAPLSFIEVLEHSLILHCGRGAKERRRKNKGEGFPRAGAVTGGKREGAQCNIPEESEEENAKEKGKGQSEGIGERDEDEQEGCAVGVRTGAARVQRKTETSLTAYPPLLLIDANLESEQDAACWRAPAGVAAQLRRGRGRKETRGTDSRGVRTSDEATREGREESRRCRPSFLGSGFWVKLQPSGEATETERLPRVRQEAFPGAVHSSPGRQGQAEKSSETRDEGDDDGGEAANVTSPVELRDVEEEERLLLFVRVPEPYLRMRRVPSKSGLEQFSEAGCASTVSARSSCAHSASPSLSSTALVPAARAAHPSLSSSPSSLDALRRVVTAEEAGERGKEGNGRGDAQPEPAGEEKDGGERGTEPARCGNDLGSSGGECREVSGQTSEGENDGTATEERKEAERRPAAEQDSRRKGRPGKNTWLLVNDHVLAYVKEKTVLDFSPSWKIPVLLQFTRADALESPAVVEHLAASPALWERSESDGERGDSDSRPDTRPSLVSQGLSSSRCRGASRAETAAARAVGAEGGNEQTSGTGSENAESARTQSAEMARATPAASFRLFQADKNISLHPLAATHPTTFVPLTHSELVALHRGNGLRLSTALSGRNATKEGDRLSPFSSCASSSLPSSTPLAAALSPSASSWHPRSREAGEDREREKRVEQSASETQVLREAGASGDTKRETASEAAEVERTSGEPTCGARRPDRKEEREVAKPTSFREREPSGDDVENKEQRETGEAKGMEERAELVSSDLADNEEGVHLPRVCPSVRPAAPEDREGKEENEEQRGWLVALDAEFVAEEDCYEDEEALCSLSAPRHRSQPVTRQSLALARFSGLRPGDLDLNASQFWLSTKKAIHQKLRYLVDAGCVFVGHGLSQDFRIINLFVPSSQIVDTVELFRLPGRRLLSLKFLAAHLLDLHIQQTTHDSIQDARAALLLYSLAGVTSKGSGD
ncbi:PAB-dependent poly(A)-specific ribonuclease subunit PAN2, related [Neospora caninum Liverpool]|uniref:PAB-dependent poly(A)-specific ribonuclease subunit PAN2, related n=1 Tax=Neospora caninum (strain Liverpool) TaxID=572307 RepID=F0VI86_NEOCL|nr:PAB-dependent poly(A)-specific ribonuclease subunit PAN2, related [Neospora caninum Liverpool]CBZ53447.1 PAB-dependent poly(A)-specific ribonuclease subunit PAN2, related [Neospora caninum Liverpool]|eukprot:XP_003883479.1 PAB-dependent poly(A)-specific ribonuclease subunit PAN2, related [Neospora caninum Liverpool]